MATEKRPPTELFATEKDIIDAHHIVEQTLGSDFDVNYMGMPKNVGQMGDEGFLAHSVVISTSSRKRLREVADEYELLDGVMRRICNETRAATRVLLDITGDDSRFLIYRGED